MKNIVLYILLLPSISSFSQKIEYSDYTWEEKPTTYTLSASDLQKPVIKLKDKRVFELSVEKDGAFEYILLHRIEKVNTDAGIEKSNRAYVVENAKRKIIKNQLRVINPDGKIIELSKDDIQEAVDEQTKQKYKYYAIRGLEKGSIIEEIVLSKNAASLSGKIIPIQSEDASKNIEVEIIYPHYLKYELKSYNGLPKFSKSDTTYKEKIVHILKLDSCEDLEDEKYSNYKANLKYFAYKLIANRSNLNLNSFNSIAENVHNFMYKPLESKDKKALEKYLEGITFPDSKNQEDSIKAIENYIKNEIVFIEGFDREESTIKTIIESKKANEQEMALLFVNAFNYFSIPIEVVLTNNRYDYPFDPKFENVSQLDNYLLHFPKFKRYLSPGSSSLRYPLFPYANGENFGLFVKTVELGGSEVVMKETKRIELVRDFDTDSLDLEIDFRESISNPNFKLISTVEGYEASNYQYLFSVLDDKQKEEFLENYLKNYSGESETKSEYFHAGKENIGIKPFIISASFQSNKLIEKNAENIIFKIGEAIGRQDELYQEKPRALPIENSYPRTYKRHIRVYIPEGYEVNNLEAFNINHFLKNGETPLAGFETRYTYKDHVLEVHNLEYYYKTQLPISDYPLFKNIINAAADFNKIKIILTKKSQ